ncbi:MAG: hypothetical protein COU63_00390 [Candidatus Pacebacteria bacterium CG10_big_fil_rev_8_21_14_0_10_36_11]|nr:hypothetical protein [Candidatus Pacearchaeota archaeon]OIP74213.1 MAG: hypothetical protein AUK08_03140 [Candidatus Pacebacteria bacterium CG2_30_36_39]PIR65116.1 MAG: hypothetical protein COU63_00390 [Candidatus Pacebacteria bacterium CG10_big_fil_rev_8_21_14_0_10_36_11]PJC42671.1 MAG: hypothetical protein CO040_03280 [Candidatus Pacebacteria bacterium CG_4_9_14_0_2_um_filter_36_8]
MVEKARHEVTSSNDGSILRLLAMAINLMPIGNHRIEVDKSGKNGKNRLRIKPTITLQPGERKPNGLRKY